LCIPIVIGSSELIIASFKRGFKTTKAMIFATIAYFSIIFEVILPYYSVEYTGDVLDIFCYIIGGFVFYLTKRKH